MATNQTKPTHVAVFCIDGEAHISSFNKNNIKSMYKAHPYTESNIVENLEAIQINAETVFDQLVYDVTGASEGKVYTVSEFAQFTKKNKQERIA